MDDVYMEKNRSKQIAPSTILRIFRWWIIVAIVVFSTLVAIVTPQIIFINENQILYYMSCLAEVIAALFALILAAYTVADTRLKNIASNDDTLQDYISDLQNEHFRHMFMVSVNCILTILLCLIVINTYHMLPQKLFSALIVDASVLGSISTISLTLFVWAVCDPKAFQQKGDAAKDELDQAYAGNMTKDDFRLFLGYYNRLEFLISRYAGEMSNDNNYKYQRKQIPIFQSLDILMSRQIFDEYVYAKIDEFRRYRNALVHSTNPGAINSGIYNELKEVYALLEQIFSSNKNGQREYISQLSDYCKQHLLNELDKKVIDYLRSHSNARLVDIAREIGISRPTAANIIRKLIQTGKVQVDDSGENKSYSLID